MSLSVIFEDDHLIVVNKPGGVVVHRTRGAPPGTPLLQQVRGYLHGQHVYPVHRLDRGTSGLLLMAKNPEAAAACSKLFQARQIDKTYRAIVRGWIAEDAGEITQALRQQEAKDSPLVTAHTQYQVRQRYSIPIPVGRYDTARYSEVDIRILTGRWRQIRRHFSHIRHPILGDGKHGDRHHNKVARELWQIPFMCLTAIQLRFIHPFSKTEISLTVPPGDSIRRMLAVFDSSQGTPQ